MLEGFLITLAAFTIGGAVATYLCRKEVEKARKELNKPIEINIRHED